MKESSVIVCVDEDQAFEVFVGFCEEGAVGAVDPAVTVVPVWSLDFDVRWCVFGYTFLRDALEWCEYVCACLDGVGSGHDARITVADVGVRVWVFERCIVWVDGP
jgi:hypothetical protein